MNTTTKAADHRMVDALEVIAWGERHFGSLITNNQFPLRLMRRLVKNGLAVSAGMVLVCDDDGAALEPERWREGFKLTAAGRQLVEQREKSEAMTA